MNLGVAKSKIADFAFFLPDWSLNQGKIMDETRIWVYFLLMEENTGKRMEKADVLVFSHRFGTIVRLIEDYYFPLCRGKREHSPGFAEIFAFLYLLLPYIKLDPTVLGDYGELAISAYDKGRIEVNGYVYTFPEAADHLVRLALLGACLYFGFENRDEPFSHLEYAFSLSYEASNEAKKGFSLDDGEYVALAKKALSPYMEGDGAIFLSFDEKIFAIRQKDV